MFLLLLEVVLNLIHRTFYFANSIYLLDTYIRHVIFLYLIHYFVKKSMKLNENGSKKYHKKIAIVLIMICLLFFSIIILFGMIHDPRNLFCREKYWLGVRVAGIVLTGMFVIIGYRLIRKYFKEMNVIYRDFWGLLFKESQNPNVSNVLIEKQIINLLKNY